MSVRPKPYASGWFKWIDLEYYRSNIRMAFEDRERAISEGNHEMAQFALDVELPQMRGYLIRAMGTCFRPESEVIESDFDSDVYWWI